MNEANQTPPTENLEFPKIDLDAALKKFEAAPLFVMKRENYFNQDGLRIEENILVSGAFPEGFPRWVGHGICTVPLPYAPNYRPAPGEQPKKHRQPIAEPVPGNTIEEAFANAPEILKASAERFQKHFLENLVGNIAQNVIRKKLTEGIRPG